MFTHTSLKGLEISAGVSPRYIESLCTWISETGELPFISGEKGSVLTPEILKSWERSSEWCFVLLKDGQPIAFAALSKNEAPLPAKSVEAVHLIVHPNYRRLGIASAIHEVRTLKAAELGFDRVFIRVVPTNLPPFEVLSNMGVQESLLTPVPGFKWLEIDVKRIRKSIPKKVQEFL